MFKPGDRILVTPVKAAGWAVARAGLEAITACDMLPDQVTVASHWSVNDERRAPGTAKKILDVVKVFKAALARTTGKEVD